MVNNKLLSGGVYAAQEQGNFMFLLEILPYENYACNVTAFTSAPLRSGSDVIPDSFILLYLLMASFSTAKGTLNRGAKKG